MEESEDEESLDFIEKMIPTREELENLVMVGEEELELKDELEEEDIFSFLNEEEPEKCGETQSNEEFVKNNSNSNNSQSPTSNNHDTYFATPPQRHQNPKTSQKKDNNNLRMAFQYFANLLIQNDSTWILKDLERLKHIISTSKPTEPKKSELCEDSEKYLKSSFDSSSTTKESGFSMKEQQPFFSFHYNPYEYQN